MLVKFLEGSVEWEATRKDHPKSKDSIARPRKLLMASHNIFYVLLINKEFIHYELLLRMHHFTLFNLSMCLAAL